MQEAPQDMEAVSISPLLTPVNYNNRRFYTVLCGIRKNYRQKLVIILWNDRLMKGFRHMF